MRRAGLIPWSLAALAVYGQQPAQEPCRLEGKTVNAVTGEPLRKVNLTLRPASQGTVVVATSDAEGKFVFDNVTAGSYRLAAERTGFVRQEYGARGNSFLGTTLTLSPGQQLKELEFKLTPQGVITGKVVDEDGDPVWGAAVSFSRQTGRGSQSRMMNAGAMTTNDVGEFRVASLAPGRYLVSAQVRRDRFGGETVRQTSGKPEEDFVNTYYPGVTDAASAAPIEVGAGQTVSGIEIRLRKSRVYRVRGKTAPGPAGLPRNVRLMLLPRDRSGSSMTWGGYGAGPSSAQVKPDGSFELSGVPPGSYHLTAMRMEGRSVVLGRVPVDVAGGNVDGVLLRLGDTLEMSGTIRAGGDEPVRLQGIGISLRPADAMAFNTPNASAKDNGAFRLEDVSRDKYYLTFYNLPDGVYVRSVRGGGQELLDKGIDLTQAEAAPALEVILSAKAATVDGLVKAEDKPATGAFVMMMPEPNRPELTYLFKSGSTDQNGRVTLKNVAPGDYRLYAFEEPQFNWMNDPDFFKPFESKSVKLTVHEGGHEMSELTLLKTE